MDERDLHNGNTAMVLGIISLVIGVLGFFKLTGIVLGIVGIVLSHKIRSEVQTANTGFILSIIGLVLCSLRLLIWIPLFMFPLTAFWWL